MSPYLLTFIVLVFFTLVSFFSKKTDNILYTISIFLLTILLIFRYGQAQDYQYYELEFKNISKSFSIVDLWLLRDNFHSNYGFLLVELLLKKIGLTFSWFVAFIGIANLYFVNKFINKYSVFKMFSLTLLYPVYYLIFMGSILRNGLVVFAFAGILVPKLLEGKIKQFCVISMLLSFIHPISLAFIPLVFLKKIKISTLNLILILSIPFGLYLSYEFARMFLSGLISVDYYFNANQMQLTFFNLGKRIFSFAVVGTSYYLRQKKEKSYELEWLFKIYIYGQILFVLFISNSTAADRTALTFAIVDIAIIPLRIKNHRSFSILILGLMIMFSSVIMFKTINDYLWMGNYYSNVSVWNYPYISIFNKQSILKYRPYLLR